MRSWDVRCRGLLVLFLLLLCSGVFAQTSADLAIVKTDSPDPVTAGENITYTITLTNNGPDAAQNVTVTDGFVNQRTFVSFTTPPGFTTTTPAVGDVGTVLSSTPTFAAGTTAVFTLVVKANPNLGSGASITNVASVSSNTPDPNTGNNASTISTSVVTSADLVITKSDTPDPVIAGTNITYTITMTNNGPSNSANASLHDQMPANTTFVSFTAPAGFGVSTPPVGGSTGAAEAIASSSLAAGATATFTLVVRVNANTPPGSTITNTVTTRSVVTTDPDTTNNTFVETTTVDTQADLSLVKSDSPDPVVAGADLTYTLTLNNAGPSDAASVSLSDTLPANTTFVSLAGPAGFTLTTPAVGGTGTVTATATSLAAGANAPFTLVVHVDPSTTPGSTIDNTASVTTTTTEVSGTNNSDTETTTVVAQADLSVTKSDAPDPVLADSDLTYTITLNNAGPSDAASVSLSDTLPANTTFVSFTAPAGFTVTAPAVGGTGTVTATRAAFAAGANASFTLVVHVDPSTPAGTTITNTASVTSETTEVNATNNSATETTSVLAQADLSVTKGDAPDPVLAGTDLTYTITLNNAGPSDAASVSLSDTVPVNATFVSFTAPAGFTVTAPAVGGTGTITADTATFASGASATFTLVVHVAAGTAGGTTITNTASVTTSSTDPNVANNSGTATTTVANQANLSITKSVVGSGPFVAGENVTFSIVVANAGPDAATNVTATDTLPAGSTLVSATPTQGSCSGTGPVVCSLGTIAAGSSVSITLILQTSTTPGAQQNHVTVTAPESDTNSQNNAATAPFTTAAAAVAQPIPTLSGWMLLALMAAMAAIGVRLTLRE